MAASGKKNKKNKWKAVDVTTVLAETRPVATSWADEAEIDERDIQIAAARKSTLPTAPRSARGTDDERVPNAPPFVAYITNIPFELIEDDIVEFFGELQIENIRLPRNDATGKLKGYGYVEFTERQGLIEALGIGDKSMKGRRIRIEVSENSERDRGGFGRSDRMGRDRMGMGMDREYDPERTAGDWRSGPRSEPAGEDRMRPGGRSGYGSGGFGDREGDRGGDRGGFGAPRESDNREGGWREGMGSGNSGGGGSSFGDRDRDRDSYRSRGFGDRDRDGGGFGGSRYGGDRDGGFGDRPREGYGDRPRYGDRDGDRYGDRPRFGDRDREEGERFARRDDAPPSEQSGEPVPVRARPKLNLAPRTRPIENPLPPPEEVKKEEKPVEDKPAPAPAPSVPRASIFGSAKPVDTTAREREIEERLAREKDRAPRREEQDKNTENSRPKESHEEGDESKKIEPAPPPKENAWSRRPRIDIDNGDSTGDERRATSPGSNGGNSAERGRPGSRQDENSGRSRSSADSKEREGDNRYNRSGSRDQQDNRETELTRSQDDVSNSDRYERKGGRGSGRGGSQGSTRGLGQGRDERGGGGGNKGKQPPDRPSRKDHSNEDQPHLPKYAEKAIPNFADSNKFAYLKDEDHEGASD